MALRMGELFAGYGGLGMGVAQVLDVDLAWVSEVDKGANKILAHRFPGVPNHGDITQIDWSQVEPVDVLTGGSPCQDLSGAGKRAGMTEGTRSNLWVAMREAIAQLRPRLVVWENVRGAASAGADSALEFCPGCMGDGRPGVVLRALGRVLGDFSDLGYVGRVGGLRVADVGGCHGRFRYFAFAADAQRGGLDGWAPISVGRAVGRAPIAGSGEDSGMPLNVAVSLLPTPAVNDMGAAYTPEEWDAWTAKMQAEHGNGNGHGKSLNIEAQRLGDGPHRHVRRRVETEGPTPFGECCGARTQSWRLGDGTDYGPAIARWHDLFRCVPPPTEVGPKGGARLSPRFSEWMMGLPAGWVTDVPNITRNEALKALGNGVVPQQAAAALRILLAMERAA